MHRIALLFLVLCCACSSDETPPAATPESEVTAPGLNTVADQTTEQRDFAQQRVDRVDRMYLEGRLRCDTVTYQCTGRERGGTFTLCYLGDELVKADHLASPARATLVYTEVYYLEDGEVYFAALASDPPTEAGGSLPTLETQYFYKGTLVDRTGPELRGAVGAQALLAVAQRGSYTCD